jgi:hypothetical protein
MRFTPRQIFGRMTGAEPGLVLGAVRVEQSMHRVFGELLQRVLTAAELAGRAEVKDGV